MMKKRLSDEDLDNFMKEAIMNSGEWSIRHSNLIIVELLNRLLEKE